MKHEISRFVFWLNVLSFHQSAFIRALAANGAYEVHVAYEQDLPPQRMDMGWKLPDFGSAKVWDVRDPRNMDALLEFADPRTCHAFGGYFVTPRAALAFQKLRSAACCRVLISEAFDSQGWKGAVRLQRARWHSLRAGRRGFHRVFAMGEIGARFFRRAWFKRDQVREFGYTVDSEVSRVIETPQGANRELRVIFVGQLIRRKAVDVLLDALSAARGGDWQLSVVGDGIERSALERQAVVKGISSKVSFHGNLANSAAIKQIENSDCLVLPSRWDGWGAVVNEAMLRGTPVIVSDACGAASLVRGDLQGSVVQRESGPALAEALGAALANGPVGAEERVALSNWAHSSIGASAMADYFVDSLCRAEYMVPPWKAGSASPETSPQSGKEIGQDV